MRAKCVQFCRALADETRQEILNLLQDQGELCVADIVSMFDVAQPTISHHLKVLKSIDLVTSRKEGKKTYYAANQGIVSTCCGTLMVRFVPEPDKVVAAFAAN
jgi:DNA-binding transcriptional ArsR family regulator